MKRRLPVLLFALCALLPFRAGAQERVSQARDTATFLLRDKGAVSRLLSRTLWHESRNAAGLSVRPLPVFDLVEAEYDWTEGNWHRYPSPSSLNRLAFDTQGALKVGAFNLWGRFRYENLTEKGTRFNTILYDPYDDRQVFSVVDGTLSDWKKQNFDLEAKAALPLVPGLLYGGLDLHYIDYIAAKQHDPRCESYRYALSVRPSLALQAGKHLMGLSLGYQRMYERTMPVVSASGSTHYVYKTLGLGNFVLDTAGGNNSIGTIFYTCNAFGGALQWGWKGPVEFLLEAGADYFMTRTRESATQPYNMGSTNMLDAFASFRLLTDRNHFSLKGNYRSTAAIYYSPVWVTSENRWVDTDALQTGRYTTLSADARWEHYLLSGDSWSWKFFADAAYTGRDESYILPKASLAWRDVSVLLGAGKRIPLRICVLEAGVEAGYIQNLGGGYRYDAVFPDTRLATEYYPYEAAILTKSRWQAALDFSSQFYIGSRMSLGLRLHGSYLRTVGPAPLDRYTLSGGVCFIF